MLGFLANLVSWIWNGIQAVADAAVIALQWAYRGLRLFSGAIWDASGWFYQNILKPIGQILYRAYDRLRGLYEQFVQPVIDWLGKLSALLRQLYTTFVAPILSIIDGIQRVLQLLETFHIEWAKELDDALQSLEDKLSKPLQLAIQFINGIISRIETYVLTADNLFQRVTHMRTIVRDLNAIGNLHAWQLMNTLSDKQKAGPSGSQPLATADDQAQWLDNVFSGNDQATGLDVESSATLMEQLFDGSYSPAT
jgi:hypothetical protein